MKICVVGLWHLGTVTAACLASVGHQVVGLDFDEDIVQNLQLGQPPLDEPDLAEMIQQGINQRRLSFSADASSALAESDIVWIAFDTPVDEEDRTDVDYVVNRIIQIFPHLPNGSLVLISSQLPAGTTRRLEEECAKSLPDKGITFGCSPENLQHGKAVAAFTKPDRIVVGLRNSGDVARVTELLAPISTKISWVSVESAEMIKHALNAFLGVSVAFMNEIACICERVGADIKEVERSLKSDARIGSKAYFTSGAAFAGGALARDVGFLTQLGASHQQPIFLIPAIYESNESHKKWNQRTLSLLYPNLAGLKIGIWGLTAKSDTDTLPRPSSVELCQWLSEQGAFPQVHDPAIKTLPEPLNQIASLHSDPLAVLKSAAALVVGTEWTLYKSIFSNSVVAAMQAPIVLDPNRFLAESLGRDARIRYFAVGKIA
jgi:UDPglucose 6-dehydrogenase